MRRSLNNGGVVVIGELNVDMVATGLKGPPRMGAEIVAADFELTLGSASAIFACGVAKLGHKVTFISQVGRDDFGEFCLKALRAARVPTDNVLIDRSVKTGVTVSLSTRTDRALVTYPGAIASFNYGQLKMVQLRGQRHLHMTSYFLQDGLRPSFPQIFREARRMGLTTSFDPNSDPEQAWGRRVYEVLAQTDVLFLNETEARQLTRARGVRSALKILGQSVPCAVIKLGPKGAVAIKDGEVASSPGFKVETLDTTGAGDSFAAGFISTYLRGGSLAECLRAGNVCGALSTLKAGGTAGQPDARALKAFLKAQGDGASLEQTARRKRR
jgi:sugar/nucleoside kinase (ribokinase family)